MRTRYFTICSANYLAYARTLHETLTAADPSAAFTLILCDEGHGDAIRGLPFEVVEAKDLGLPAFGDMALRYTVMELNTAVKPACVQHFWARGEEAVVYLDPDLYVLRPLAHVTEALAAGAPIVLTPHLTAPLRDSAHPSETTILQTGAYNLGFGAFRRCAEAEAFVSWWAERCERDCIVDLPAGLFVDQKFADYAPSFAGGTYVLRHPGYNAAYWNLSHRPIEGDAGRGHTAAGEALHFFHFSGVVPGDPKTFSKHQDRFAARDLGPALRGLLEDYLHRLDANGHDQFKDLAYAYGTLPTGGSMPDVVRFLLRRAHPDEPIPERRRTDPFAYANEAAPGRGQVTRLMEEVWRGRPDLMRVFDIGTPAGQAGMAAWFGHAATAELALPSAVRRPAPAAEGPGPSTPARAAGLALRHVGRLRPVYRHVPLPVRARLRDALVRGQVRIRAVEPLGPPNPRARRPGVQLTGYLRAPTGVGEGARRALTALRAAEVPVATIALPNPAADMDALAYPHQDVPPGGYGVALWHVNADQLPLVAAVRPRGERRDRYVVGYWAWELDRFPEAWSGAFDHVHEVWVPSRFVAEAVRLRTDLPVRVVPHVVPVTAPDERVVRGLAGRHGIESDRHVVLTAFDANSYLSRKNPGGALAAFTEAFGEDGTEAQLVVKAHGRGVEPAARELRATLAARSDVVLIDEVLTAEEVRALHALSDVFLSVHRSEGFGLNLADAMASGRPVVATDWSGSADFVDDAVGVPVPYTLVPVDDAYPHGQDASWAEPDLGAAAEGLVLLARDDDLRARLGEAGRRRVADRYAPGVIGERMRGELRRIDPRLAGSGGAERDADEEARTAA